MLFSDTAIIQFQAKKEEGGLNTEIMVEPEFKQGPPAGVFVSVLKELPAANNELAVLKYQLYNDNRKKNPKSKITRNKAAQSANDGHFRLYQDADAVLEIGNAGESYENVLDFMSGKVSGVDINGNEVRIRGTGSFNGDATPLFLVDGVPLVTSSIFNLPAEVTQETDREGMVIANQGEQVIQTVRSIPLSDIEKVEVLKSAQNMALFGTKGSNGVIAIYTKHGYKSNEKSVAKGIIETKVAGYTGYRSFYSPSFLPGDSSTENVLLNTLLYWSPDVVTRNGITELQFYTTDLTGNFEVVAEGIANDGKICIGKATFTVK
jgi:TonB-dependent SusC/RagA subfamily outer membrane receptor